MVDRYTKVVLTIIAACLMIIAVKDLPLLRTAAAQQPTTAAQQPTTAAQQPTTAAQEPTHVVVDQFGAEAFAYAFRHVHEPLLVRVEPR